MVGVNHIWSLCDVGYPVEDEVSAPSQRQAQFSNQGAVENHLMASAAQRVSKLRNKYFGPGALREGSVRNKNTQSGRWAHIFVASSEARLISERYKRRLMGSPVKGLKPTLRTIIHRSMGNKYQSGVKQRKMPSTFPHYA